MNPDRAEQILAFAEREIRRGGVDAVSFRDIATAIGIKSASVHYHFPTKADLMKAVTTRYIDRFIGGLGQADDPSEQPRDRLERLSDAYLAALRQDSSTCLCAVLGSVSMHLPDGTADLVNGFFGRLRHWIETALASTESRISANLVISLLQGAMILSVAMADESPLIEAKQQLLSTLDAEVPV